MSTSYNLISRKKLASRREVGGGAGEGEINRKNESGNFAKKRGIYSARICILILFCLFVDGTWAQESNKSPDTLESLQKRIAEIIDKPCYSSAFWGIKITSLASGKTIFERNAEKLFSPASNSKLYTMALALDRLGPDYRIKTSLYARNRVDKNGILEGNLVVYGRGDPTISGEYNNGDIFKALEPFVAALTNAGVKQISGDLIGDDSYFHGPPFGSGWSWEDLENEYGAEISALTINSNTVQLIVKPGAAAGVPAQVSFSPATTYLTVSNFTKTISVKRPSTIHVHRAFMETTVYVTGEIPIQSAVWSRDVTVPSPAGWFVALLKDALVRHGVAVSGSTRGVDWIQRRNDPFDAKQWLEIGSVQSHPFREIIRSVEKPSQNLYTDLILDAIGARAGGSSEAPTEAMGVRELNRFLNGAGIPRENYYFEEGSGLSRDNLVTPGATVALLTYMSHQTNFDVYFNALPIAGVDGTLRARMIGTAAAANVRAKTGSLRWADSLSGYLTTAAGEHLAFSLMLNRFQNPDREHSKKEDIDAITEMLAGFNAPIR